VCYLGPFKTSAVEDGPRHLPPNLLLQSGGGRAL